METTPPPDSFNEFGYRKKKKPARADDPRSARPYRAPYGGESGGGFRKPYGPRAEGEGGGYRKPYGPRPDGEGSGFRKPYESRRPLVGQSRQWV